MNREKTYREHVHCNGEADILGWSVLCLSLTQNCVTLTNMTQLQKHFSTCLRLHYFQHCRSNEEGREQRERKMMMRCDVVV